MGTRYGFWFGCDLEELRKHHRQAEKRFKDAGCDDITILYIERSHYIREMLSIKDVC